MSADNPRSPKFLLALLFLSVALFAYTKSAMSTKRQPNTGAQTSFAPTTPAVTPSPTPEPVTPAVEPIEKFGLLPPAPTVPSGPQAPLAQASLDDGQIRWLLACSAMLFEANNEDHTVLAGMPLNDKNREDNRTRLKKFWGITTTAELNKTIADLETRLRFDGCRALAKESPRISEADYEKALADKMNLGARFTLRLHDGPNDPNFLVAWDYCRAMNITRWGYAGGLLTEDQALAHLKRLGLKLQASYLSWYQMGMDYALAFEIWSEGDTRRKIFFQLMTRPDSPWKTNPWITVLPK